MPANAPHRITSEYSTCSAEAISRVTIVKLSTSNDIIVVIILGEPIYEFVATLKPFGVSFELIDIIIVLVRRK